MLSPTRLVAAVLFLLGFAATVPRARAAADAPTVPGKGRAEHVVIVVWDGMRPDFVTAEHTPTLAKLAAGGVFFERHHAVYPTSTEVNGTVLATGVWPARSGIIANREYRPAIDALKNVPTEVPEVVAKGDRLTGGKFVAVPTLPELVRAAGGRTAVAATKGVGLLWDRGERADGSVTVVHGHTVPEAALTAVEAALGGPFPADPPRFPNVAQDTWTTRALTEVLWRDGVPALSVLWLSDPDYSQHATAPGAPVALAALRTNADANLARVLAALEARGVRERTDVIVVSDHGFSTISESVNAEELLSRAGFQVHSQLAAAPLPKGDVFYVGLGGTMCFYVGEHDAGTRDRLVRFLQGSAFAGVIFTRGPADVPGTFPLGEVHLDTPDAPDVMVALRWTDAKNAAGVAGTILGDHNRQAGSGTHATLSAYDLHNTMVAAGPDFRVGFRSATPSGNLDVAPTVAALLGLSKAADKMDGRVLGEALAAGPDPVRAGPVIREDAARATAGSWEQRLDSVTVQGATYLEQGNGKNSAAAVPEQP